MVPALLGYIDKARNGQYLEEAHSIYTAMQVVEDELYAAGDTSVLTFGAEASDKNTKEINQMVEPTVLTSATVKSVSGTAGKNKKDYSIDEITTMTFTSQNGKTVTITMAKGGKWGDPSIS